MLTVKTLQSMRKRPNTTKAEKLGRRGAGALEFRALPGGELAAAFRYSLRGVRSRAPLGSWDEQSQERSLQGLRRRAQELAKRLQDGLPVVEALGAGTLQGLLGDYLETLDNPRTRKQVGNVFKRTVPKKFLTLPAASITSEQVLGWLAARARQGVTTEVNRARSWLHAAFQKPISAKGNPLHAAGQTGVYGLTTNPVAGTVRVGEFEMARDRILTDDELRSLWAALQGMNPDAARAVELSLRLAGQRAEQLVLATMDQGAVRMLDSKGRRAQPRVHLLSVPVQAAHLVEGIAEGARIFKLSAEVLRNTVNEIGAVQGWTYRDLRRTCESRLAELGIRKELRDLLQSHDQSGVTVRHYNRADWMPQLAVALEAWNRRLDDVLSGASAASNVTPLSRAG